MSRTTKKTKLKAGGFGFIEVLMTTALTGVLVVVIQAAFSMLNHRKEYVALVATRDRILIGLERYSSMSTSMRSSAMRAEASVYPTSADPGNQVLHDCLFGGSCLAQTTCDSNTTTNPLRLPGPTSAQKDYCFSLYGPFLPDSNDPTKRASGRIAGPGRLDPATGRVTCPGGDPNGPNPIRYDRAGNFCAGPASDACPFEAIVSFRPTCAPVAAPFTALQYNLLPACWCASADVVKVTYTVRVADGVSLRGLASSLAPITGSVEVSVSNILSN